MLIFFIFLILSSFYHEPCFAMGTLQRSMSLNQLRSWHASKKRQEAAEDPKKMLIAKTNQRRFTKLRENQDLLIMTIPLLKLIAKYANETSYYAQGLFIAVEDHSPRQEIPIISARAESSTPREPKTPTAGDPKLLGFECSPLVVEFKQQQIREQQQAKTQKRATPPSYSSSPHNTSLERSASAYDWDRQPENQQPYSKANSPSSTKSHSPFQSASTKTPRHTLPPIPLELTQKLSATPTKVPDARDVSSPASSSEHRVFATAEHIGQDALNGTNTYSPVVRRVQVAPAPALTTFAQRLAAARTSDAQRVAKIRAKNTTDTANYTTDTNNQNYNHLGQWQGRTRFTVRPQTTQKSCCVLM